MRRVQSRRLALAGFVTPSALVAYLNSRDEDAGARNAVFATLVSMVQERDEGALASTLLWLGLWPALDAIYRRRRRCFESSDELTSALSFAFSSLVARVDLWRTHRVAATLVLGAERDLMKALQRTRTEVAQLEALHQGTVGLKPWAEPPAASALGLPARLSLESEEGALREWLLPLAGGDTELVVSVLLHEESHAQVGARLGLAPEVARKRFQRALRRLRKMADKFR
ncbi:sigma-70 family RNA polymerase sigma factor [Myxococcus faecalis]|uniref:sigma-70 family RNA polymerase sigma factor n=1 Tax=Myxococcus faecalis TaxID=3115646 RepID=UPI003CEAB03B